MKHYLRFSLTLLLLVLVGGVGFAQTITFDATTDKGSTATSLEKDGISLNISGGALNNGTDYRTYSGKKLTISTSAGTITNIEFTCTANNTTKYGPGCFTVSKGTYTYKDKIGTWTGSEDAVVFTASSNQVRATKIVVTVSSKTKTTTTFGTTVDDQTFTLTEGDEFPKYTATTTDASGNAVAGTIAYTSDNACVTVDANGQTAAGKGFGTAKITATFTPTEADKYEASSASYTITYNEKVAEGAIVFSAENNSFSKLTNGYQTKNIDFSYNGKNYTFSCVDAMKSNSTNYLQLKKETGKVTSPTFEFTNGYKVKVVCQTNDGVTLSSGNASKTGKDIEICVYDPTAKFTISTGTKYALVSSITIEPLSFDYTWNDTEDNVIPNEGNKTVKINRTVVKDEYNTICLPFDIVGAEEIAATFGEGTKVYEFYSAEENTLTFIDTDVIDAGTPYLLKPTETKNEIVYTGDIYGSEDLLATVTEGEYSFIGTYNPATLKTDGTNLFFVAGAKLAKPESDQNDANRLKGFRAYMQVPAASANALKVCIDGITASINDIKSDLTISDGKVYNLNGQYVGNSMQNLAKGVYVQNGKKYVVK